MTLTATDIAKIQEHYRILEQLHAQRGFIKDLTTVTSVGVEARKGTSGRDYHQFADFSAEASKEIRETIARDLRRRAAKIVETLHKYGCEAKLTEE